MDSSPKKRARAELGPSGASPQRAHKRGRGGTSTPAWKNWLTAVRARLSETFTPDPSEKVVGLATQRDALLKLLRRMLAAQENHSMLLVGYHGSGKSMLLRHVLRILAEEKKPGLPSGDATQGARFRVIHLSGRALRNDVEALREISRQLCLTPDDGEDGWDEAKGGEDGTTQTETTTQGSGRRKNGPRKQQRKSFAQHLAFVIGALRDGRASNVPIILVLDHFEGFAGSRKQTLLYNLFDLTQSASVQVAVIGISTRLDVVDMLEKRLKSRFSHRQLLFTQPNYDTLLKVLDTVFSVPRQQNSLYARMSRSLSDLVRVPAVKKMMVRQVRAGQSVRWFYRWFDRALAEYCRPVAPFLTATDLETVYASMASDPLYMLVQDMSRLDLSLLIAMSHLDHINDSPFNFEMVFEEYSRFGKSEHSQMQMFPKAVALKTYEYLIELGIARLVAKDSSETSLPLPFQMTRLVLEPFTLLSKIQRGEIKAPTDLKVWAGHRIQEV